MALVLAGLVFLVTVVATALISYGNAMSDAPMRAADSPAPVFIIGMGISGMLVLSHWVHWTW